MSRRVAIGLCSLLFACGHEAKQKPEIKMLPVPRVELSPPPPKKSTTAEIIALRAAPAHPNVAVRIAFRAGSVDDPPGQEGITALAAELMAQGGTEKLSAAELLRALYPMAASVDAATDAEMTVFEGQVHKDHVERFLPILLDAVAHPRWDPKEFERLRQDAINEIEKRLRTSDDEELGKEALESHLFGMHPYGHLAGGSVSSLRALTLEQVKAHAQRVFTRSRLIIGVAGAYPAGTAARIDEALASLPSGDAASARVPPPPAQVEPRVLIVEKPTDSVAISIGHPWALRRGDADYPAMRLALSAFGEHRQFIGRLMDRLRSIRGLNYGDYAYVEHFEQDAGTTYPVPNIPRSFQTFTIWIRPVEAQNGVYALRAALWETKKLVDGGLSEEEVARAQKFLAGYLRLYTQTDTRRLGYAIDDAWYKTPDHQDHLIADIGKLTPAEVNAAIRKWIKPDELRIVVVTRDAAAFEKALLADEIAPIHYDAPMPEEVLAEDARIRSFPLHLEEKDIRVVKASELFEK